MSANIESVQVDQRTVDDGSIPRSEHPNPQFQRDDFFSLNGIWSFEFDDEDRGLSNQWYNEHAFTQQILVPFAYQSKLSGIADPSFHDIVWYQRELSIPSNFVSKRVLLHFGAVDYKAHVWLNGNFVGQHEGGHTPFTLEITKFVEEGKNNLVVRAEDYSKDLSLPRGKQFWEEQSTSIFYTRTTGIWQSVWVEAVPYLYIQRVKAVPDLDVGAVDLNVSVIGYENPLGQRLEFLAEVSLNGEKVSSTRMQISSAEFQARISVTSNPSVPIQPWSPENPTLYDVTYSILADDHPLDCVTSYLGIRKIAVENGVVLLNNRPYYLRLVLDQGYFPDGNLTPPSDEAIRDDVALTKALGFNGARKHQKIEDPRYLYWCDKLGLVVWGEMANSYEFSERAVSRLTSEWQEAIARDFNHPCIIAWVPLNESWGVPNLLSDARQRAFLDTLYYLTKTIDPTRLVISNDGWEHTHSDLCTIHDYESSRDILTRRYSSRESAVSSTPGQRLIYAPGYKNKAEPILITEMGGISYKKSDWEGWGYSSANDDDDFIQRYFHVIQAMWDSPVIQGFCYTQLTDVEQEINGLLTYDRKPKVPIDVIRSITEGHGIPSREK